MPVIGVLAMQGAFAEHRAMLRRLDVESREVRLPPDLDGLDGLIIPGGESTTMGKLIVEFGLLPALRQLVQQCLPIYGTCAGMILLADRITGGDQPLIGGADLLVRRNAFGRQLDSFEADIAIPALGDQPFHAVFIRAPVVDQVGPNVEVLARLDSGAIVAARDRHLLVSAFHPELTQDTRFHSYFLGMVGTAQPHGTPRAEPEFVVRQAHRERQGGLSDSRGPEAPR